jgi:hypothetical protein
MGMPDLSLRLSQTISPFGVGAICVLNGESFVGMDIGRWARRGDRIECERLAAVLAVDFFHYPPVKETTFGARSEKIPYARFPRWLFCMSCRQLVYWRPRDEIPGSPPSCNNNNCQGSKRLIPMRFVQVCENGHLDDVEWHRWAHSRTANNYSQRGCQDQSKLKFDTIREVGGGLGSLRITCQSCKAQRSLEGITHPEGMKRIGVKCSGCQPWENLPGGQTSCTADPQIVQSGAGNVYFPHVPSAIDIPPESNYKHRSNVLFEIQGDELFPTLKDLYNTGPGAPAIPRLISSMAARYRCSEDIIRSILEENGSGGLTDRDATSNQGEFGLLQGEWSAFITPVEDDDERNNFVTRHVELVSKLSLGSLDSRLEKVVQATKLREVRALAGFSRYERNFVDTNKFVKSDLGRDLKWLPAIEVYGEGIFLSFEKSSIGSWETGTEVANRARMLADRTANSFRSAWLPSPTPRLLMLHTFSHMLIRQLTYECGYSSAALRERIYSSDSVIPDGMAGILIYTASGDSEGTLGGLVRQATPETLERLIVNALDRASWCSNDPVCSEITGQGIDALNLAACHACALIPETSCCYGNCLLDRSAVLGTLANGKGFLDDVLSESRGRLI